MTRPMVALMIVLNGCGGGEGDNEELPYLTGQVPDLGVRIAAENRCAPYDPGDYSYPQSVELDIIEMLGGIYSPYTGQCFRKPGGYRYRAYCGPFRSPRQRIMLGG